MSLIIINPEVKNLDNFFQSKYNSFEELQRDLISAASIFKLKRRNHFLFKYFNKKQSHFEKKFERIFFHQLISFQNIDKLTNTDKQFIELFYFQYFSYHNFRKTIQKDKRIAPIALVLSILICSEKIFYDFVNSLYDCIYSKYFIQFLYINMREHSIQQYNFYDKKLIINFIDLLKLKLEQETFTVFSEDDIFINTLIRPYEAYLLKQKMENF